MANSTTNYGLTKPTADEFYDIDVQNGNMDIIDAQMKLSAEKLAADGDGGNLTVAFVQATERSNIAAGEKLSVIFGKIKRWFADLGALAFKSVAAKGDLASDVQASLGKADTALQNFAETDPTVSSWAKEPTKPTYTADEVGAAVPYHGMVTLTVASWVGSAAPFVYTIVVTGMTDDDNTGVGVAYSADESANAVLDKAWQAAKPRIESVAGQLKIIARGTKPTVAIPIFYRGSR